MEAARSTGEARKLVQSGGVRLNGQVVEDPRTTLQPSAAMFGRYFLLRRGKKVYHLLAAAEGQD